MINQVTKKITGRLALRPIRPRISEPGSRGGDFFFLTSDGSKLQFPTSDVVIPSAVMER